MLKKPFFTLFLLFSAGFAAAGIEMVYPLNSSIQGGSSVQAGSVSPGQQFELGFSDNSGYGFEWDSVKADSSSLPSGWAVVSSEATDSSLSVKFRVPENAVRNYYNIKLAFSNSGKPNVEEFFTAVIVVKENLLDVSFAKKSPSVFSVVGESVPYRAVLSNSSIAPHVVRVSSTLPQNWFAERAFEVGPNSVIEAELSVNPKSYGQRPFSFTAASLQENAVVETFSSELNVRPTLKGKFGAPFSGFPFYTFTLLPFQLADSLIALAFPS